MRLWSLHPRYLDRQGLIALWREGLLAQKVLAGRTKGYRHHPQLLRFRETPDPILSIGRYLFVVAAEAAHRGYRFDSSKILASSVVPELIPVTRGQLQFERLHLLKKLWIRDRALHRELVNKKHIFSPHPSFRSVAGKVHEWEKI